MPLKQGSSEVTILGGGLAGSAAALSALQRGAPVRICERSHFPRHKVCGEFLSPEIQVPLERNRVWDRFLAAQPARIRRMALHFGKREKTGLLPETAWGLSRFVLDELLLRTAVGRGAQLADSIENPRIVASGRSAGAEKGKRLFGFKAHFTGPADDAVELYFFREGYVGINCVENSVTNVCGLAPEWMLARVGFDVDEMLLGMDALRARVAPLNRVMRWMHVGPLVFGNQLRNCGSSYVAGDALSFVDPFTGSGMLCALLTGTLAGECAADGRPVSEYLCAAKGMLGSAFSVSSFFRSVAKTDYAGVLASIVPSRFLFSATRPRVSRKSTLG